MNMSAAIKKAKQLIKDKQSSANDKSNTIIIANNESDSSIPLNLEGQLVIILDRE